MGLSDLVRNVASARKHEETAKNELSAVTKAFEKEYADIIADEETARIARMRSEERLRAAVLEASKEEVKVTDGVKIRNIKIVTYDESEAFELARKTGQYLLLDKKAFEASMKAAKGLLPPGVTIETVPQVTIARDLSGAV